MPVLNLMVVRDDNSRCARGISFDGGARCAFNSRSFELIYVRLLVVHVSHIDLLVLDCE
jgi:hypothetical protein